ncbi:hypothetical protein GORHZ_141_00450 [Gordonia rhizosphera NBRC 16068]|uniref:GyrI-like small molecule binding domain-containing protein n=2 Tax=Gordonia rhizosphera TaxID=83341 RepID=K6VXM1_9ACTN|nr:hypothetical protein GORHZ_141_00450 [Gordonia rhizosphera NBRC 16068]
MLAYPDGMAQAKIDFKKSLDSYRAAHGEFRVLDVPTLRYLMIDGHGDPNTSSAFAQAIETLYPIAYAIKFASKRELGRDYTVPPLEGLWWAQDMNAFGERRDKSRWDWTLMLMVPDWIDGDMVTAATEQVRAKKQPARLDDVRFEDLSEGRSVQTLHMGSFDDEAPVLAAMHDEFIPGHDLRKVGKHHEIYLSDFRKVAPAKLRTILRQPVARR